MTPYRTFIDIAAPPDQVYPYLTRPEAIVTWMGDYAVLDAVPGGVFHLDINGVPVRGRYLELDPPHRLLISWGHAGSEVLPPGASTVELTLAAIPGGTRVTVEHRPGPDVGQVRSGGVWGAANRRRFRWRGRGAYAW